MMDKNSINAMQWTIDHSPYIHNTRASMFVELFQAHFEWYKKHPTDLSKDLNIFFGSTSGQFVFRLYKRETALRHAS